MDVKGVCLLDQRPTRLEKRLFNLVNIEVFDAEHAKAQSPQRNNKILCVGDSSHDIDMEFVILSPIIIRRSNLCTKWSWP